MVREDIVFQRAAEDYSPPLERLTIKVHLLRRRCATIHDLFAATVKGYTTADVFALNNMRRPIHVSCG